MAAVLLAACNYPQAKAPTPFPIPASGLPSAAPETPTGTPATLPETGSTATGTPAPAAAPTQTSPANSTPAPAARPQGQLAAAFMSTPPSIDASLDEWNQKVYPVTQVVFGADKWNGPQDLSAAVQLGWDNSNLYLASHVEDNRYVQNASGYNLYNGDSLEILFDADLSGDYNSKALSPDDYQLGISPGSPKPGDNPNAYLWFPLNVQGKQKDVRIAAKAVTGGYDFEAAIPWSVFGVIPQAGNHYGFAFSASDDDKPDSQVQQKMVSTAPDRSLPDPTTWGDLLLTK